MLRHAEGYLKQQTFSRNFLFMAIGNDPDPGLHESFDAFSAILEDNPTTGLRFHHVSWQEEDHWSISHKAVYDGLKWIFRDWSEIPETILNDGVPAVKQYRNKLSQLYGYDIGINPSSLGMFSLAIWQGRRLCPT
jgi:hypothetical protein